MSIRKLVIGLSFSVFTSDALSAGQWVGNTGEIESITSHNGDHIIQTTITDNVCGTEGKYWWKADDSDAKDMFALAMMAFASGKKLGVVRDPENTSECKWNGALVTHLRVDK